MYNGLGSDVWQWDGFGPTGKTVNASQKIMKTSRKRKGANKIKVNVIKMSIWSRESSKGHSVMMNFDFLAVGAGKCPLTNIFVNARPYKKFSYEFLCGMHARMGKILEHSKIVR